MHFPIHTLTILSILYLTGVAALLDFYELPDFKGTVHSIDAKDLEPRACGTQSLTPELTQQPTNTPSPQWSSQKTPKSPPSTSPKPPKPPAVSSTGTSPSYPPSP